MYESILWHKIPHIKSRIDRVKQTLQPAGGYWPLPLSESQGPFPPSWVSLSSFRPLALPIRFLLFLFSPFSSHDCSTAVQPMPATCLLSADRFLPVPRTIYFPRVPTIYDSVPSRPALLFSPHNPFSQYPPHPLVLVLFFAPSRRPCRPIVLHLFSVDSFALEITPRFLAASRESMNERGQIARRSHRLVWPSRGSIRRIYRQRQRGRRRQQRRPRLTSLHRPYWRPDTRSTVAHDYLDTSALASAKESYCFDIASSITLFVRYFYEFYIMSYIFLN